MLLTQNLSRNETLASTEMLISRKLENKKSLDIYKKRPEECGQEKSAITAEKW
jgi:hypothetical protein